MFNIDFVHCPIDADGSKYESRAAAKAAQEAAIQKTLDDAGVDLIVLARYMQVGGGWLECGGSVGSVGVCCGWAGCLGSRLRHPPTLTYLQIFGEDFCANNWRKTINIHHSFLPAFEGGRPYHRAHERGVKIIGATAHYATSELDAGDDDEG
jgi:formyltetrahydrofolate hydrolase